MKLALNYLQLKSSILQEIPCALTLESLEQEESKQVRSGIDVICVIDVSGSMQGPKLELAKKTLKFMTTQLGPNDRACVVTFSDEAQRLCPLACMNDLGKQILDERIDNINIEGGTEIVLGLDCALQILSMRRHHNSVTSIILLSDGVDNNTSTAMNRFRASIIKSDLGILTSYSIHTFGYGKDHDANIMNAMAQVKNGGFYYVEKEDSIPQAFANCLGELMSVFADSINVILRTEAVDVPFSLTKIYSETGDSSFRMPPVLSGSKKEAIFLLCFPPCDLRVPDNHKIQPIRAFVSYKNPRSNEEFKDECLLTIDVYNEEFLIDDIKVDEDVIVNFYRVKSADVLKQAGEFGDQGLMQEARNLLAQTAQELRNSVVADNELIKILIQDLESSVDRFENRAT